MFILDAKYSGMGCIYATMTSFSSTVNDDLETSIRYCCIRAASMLEHFYRPQRSWAKVMFLQASVILSTPGGGVSGKEPPRQGDPPGSRPPRTRPPRCRHTPPVQTPPREADSSIRSTSGRYASYWNAFLSCMCLLGLPVFNWPVTDVGSLT